MVTQDNKEQIESTADARSVYNNSLYDDYVEAQKQADAAKAELQGYKDSAKKARENKTSVMKAVYNTYKPKYDEKKATDLRKVATIQSLGDMLSAATRGYFAYRDKGAGVVPNVNNNSALSSVEELNRMRETYLAENKQWRDLMADYELKAADAQIAAAESDVNEQKARINDANSRADAARKAYNDAVLKGIIAQETEDREARKTENYNEQKALDRAAADRRAEKKSGNNKDSNKKEEYTLEDYKIRDAYRKAHPRYKKVADGPESRDVPYTQEDYEKLSADARKEEMVRAKAWYEKTTKQNEDNKEQAQQAASEYGATYDWLIKAGYSDTEARKMAAEVVSERFPNLENFIYKPSFNK